MTKDATTPSPSLRVPRHAGPMLLIAIAIAAAYASTWSADYGFLDDYNLVNNSAHGDMRILRTCIEQGRPLDGLILYAVSKPIHHVATLSHARGLAQLFIVVVAWLIYAAMIRSAWPRAIAASLAVVCATLPAMQVYAAWAVEVAHPLAVAFAGAAAIAAAISGNANISPVKRRLLCVAAVAGLLCSLLIYQPAAMMFWVFIAIELFRPDESIAALSSRLLIVLRYAGIAAIALAAAGLAVRIGLHFQITPAFHHTDSAGGRATLIGRGDLRRYLLADLLDKENFLRHQVLPMALNLTNIDTNWWIAVAMSVLIATGLPIFVAMTSRRWELLPLAVALVPLAYLPNLIVTGDWPAFRTQVGIESLMAFFALLSLEGWWLLGWNIVQVPTSSAARRWLPAPPLAILAGASALAAAHVVTIYFVRPQTIEYRLAQSLLTDRELSAASSIQVIGADWSDSAAPAVYFEEFGQPSTYRPWGAVPMMELLLADQHPAYRNIPVNFVAPGAPDLPTTAGSLIIDMRPLRLFRDAARD